MTTLFTIGHSNHEIGKFVDLLKMNKIQQVVDVRSSPYSRFNPQFNRERLCTSLAEQGMNYIYAGHQLGGRPEDPSCYRDRILPQDKKGYINKVDYPEVMKKPFFLQGIQQLHDLIEKARIAILCSEEDPAACHRHHLITRYLLENHPDLEVFHIRKDGCSENARDFLGPKYIEAVEQAPLFNFEKLQETL